MKVAVLCVIRVDGQYVDNVNYLTIFLGYNTY